VIEETGYEVRSLYRETLSGETARLPLEDVLDRVIDGLVELKSAHPGFWPLLDAGPAPGAMPEAARALTRELQDRVEAVFAVRSPGLEASDRALYAEVTVQVVRGAAAARGRVGAGPAAVSGGRAEAAADLVPRPGGRRATAGLTSHHDLLVACPGDSDCLVFGPADLLHGWR
jgi:hypothetical protein